MRIIFPVEQKLNTRLLYRKSKEVQMMKWSPGQLKPMEPSPHPDPFDSDKHIFEIKWDGMRLLAFIKDEEVRLQNRSLIERTAFFPELETLYRFFHGREGIVDGELVALEEGKPSFPLLMKRCTGSAVTAASRAHRIPVVYIPFDLLYLNGEDLTGVPLMKRKDLLLKTFEGGPHAMLSPVFPKDGISLFQTVKAQGLEGIVAKGKNSPYLIGKKSKHWLKIKNRRRQPVVIGGYLISFGQLSSILVGAFWEDKLKYLGRVGSGFGKIGDELLSLLSTTPRENSPFEPTPRYKMDVHWVEPLLAAEIEFQEWTPDLKLRQPVFIKLLDVPPQTCSLFPDSQRNKKTEGKQQ
jgi:bifunctional non-homologous end joining protein LigD